MTQPQFSIEDVVSGRETVKFTFGEKSYQGARFIAFTPIVAKCEAELAFDPVGKYGAHFVMNNTAMSETVITLANKILATLRATPNLPDWVKTDAIRAPVRDGAFDARLVLRGKCYHDRISKLPCQIEIGDVNDFAPRGSIVRCVIKFATLTIPPDASKGLGLRGEVVRFATVKRGEYEPLAITADLDAYLGD